MDDTTDNAPNEFNPDQSDIDGDGVGDVSDPCPSDPLDNCDPSGSGSGFISAATGGTVVTGNGSVTLTIPPGALPVDTSISITDMGGGFTLSTNMGGALVVLAVDVQPEGTTFLLPVTLVFAWDDADGDGRVDGTQIREERLRIAKDRVVITDRCSSDPGCDTVANTFTIQVTSLSEFALLALLPAVPALPAPAVALLAGLLVTSGLWVLQRRRTAS